MGSDVLDRGPAVGDILLLPDLPVLPNACSRRHWHVESEGSLAIFVAHGADCPSCVAYAEDLAAQTSEFRWWGGRPTVVLPRADPAGEALAARIGIRFVADPDVSARHRWHLDSADAAMIVADRWGQVYLSADAGSNHGLPEPGIALTRVLTQIGIQCPECGVPDVP